MRRVINRSTHFSSSVERSARFECLNKLFCTTLSFHITANDLPIYNVFVNFKSGIYKSFSSKLRMSNSFFWFHELAFLLFEYNDGLDPSKCMLTEIQCIQLRLYVTRWKCRPRFIPEALVRCSTNIQAYPTVLYQYIRIVI